MNLNLGEDKDENGLPDWLDTALQQSASQLSILVTSQVSRGLMFVAAAVLGAGSTKLENSIGQISSGVGAIVLLLLPLLITYLKEHAFNRTITASINAISAIENSKDNGIVNFNDPETKKILDSAGSDAKALVNAAQAINNGTIVYESH